MCESTNLLIEIAWNLFSPYIPWWTSPVCRSFRLQTIRTAKIAECVILSQLPNRSIPPPLPPSLPPPLPFLPSYPVSPDACNHRESLYIQTGNLFSELRWVDIVVDILIYSPRGRGGGLTPHNHPPFSLLEHQATCVRMQRSGFFFWPFWLFEKRKYKIAKLCTDVSFS